jgi:hypothetical protein
MHGTEMKITFEAMASDIRRRAEGRTIVYIPNPGNWGDGLIRWGTKHFFHDFELPHIEVNIGFRWGKTSLFPFLLPGICSNYFFVYGGGGAWCRAYHGALETMNFISRFTKDSLTLPSTYEVLSGRLEGTFYSRGKSESLRVNRQASFCHDMAFYVVARSPGKQLRTECPRWPVGIFLRSDRESLSLRQAVDHSLDISARGDHMSCGRSFIEAVSEYHTIFTDRLHVAIAGCMTGRKVHLTSGNYYKIREVYESSILDTFDNVAFHCDPRTFLFELRQHPAVRDAALRDGCIAATPSA